MKRSRTFFELTSIFSLVLILFIVFAKSATPQTFDPVVNLSMNAGLAAEHQIVMSDTNVYVAWADTTPGNFDILFRRSLDGGVTWDPPLNLPPRNLSSNPTTSRHPKLAASGNSVFVVWGDYDNDFTQQNILFTRSSNGGASFESPRQLSLTPGVFPVLAASGSNVYVVWGDVIGDGEIFLRRSTDGGENFASVQSLSPTGAAPQVAASGANVYVVWANPFIGFRRFTDNGASFDTIKELLPGGAFPQLATSGKNVFLVWEGSISPSDDRDVYFARSTDARANFLSSNLSNNSGWSNLPQVAASGSNVFVTWIDGTPGNADIFFRSSSDSGGNFEDTLNLSANPGESSYPHIVAVGSAVHIVWAQQNPTVPIPSSFVDVMFRSSCDAGMTFRPDLNNPQ